MHCIGMHALYVGAALPPLTKSDRHCMYCETQYMMCCHKLSTILGHLGNANSNPCLQRSQFCWGKSSGHARI